MLLRGGIALSSRLTLGRLGKTLSANVRQLSTVQQHIINNTIDDALHKDIRNAYTHNPIEGYIRTSPFENVSPPNLPLDVYVWQNLSKYANHEAMVSVNN